MSIVNSDTTPCSAILRDEAFPTVDRGYRENSARNLALHGLLQTQRLLIRFVRDPMTFLSGLILPIVFLLVVNFVLGHAVSSVTGRSALYGNVPMMTLLGAMHGAAIGAVGIITERDDGLFARLWVAPVHRASGLVARISADAVRILVNSVVVLCVGLLLGLRFHQGVLASLGWLCVPLVFGLAFASVVLTVALYWPSTILADVIVLVDVLCLFFSTGFVPLDQYPHWIQPVVQHQPLSYAIETMRGLSIGGPVLHPAIGILLWSGGITAASAIPMVLGYRRFSMR